MQIAAPGGGLPPCVEGGKTVAESVTQMGGAQFDASTVVAQRVAITQQTAGKTFRSKPTEFELIATAIEIVERESAGGLPDPGGFQTTLSTECAGHTGRSGRIDMSRLAILHSAVPIAPQAVRSG